MKAATETPVASRTSAAVVARLLRAAAARVQQAKHGEMARRGDLRAVHAAEAAYAELQREMASLVDERRAS